MSSRAKMALCAAGCMLAMSLAYGCSSGDDTSNLTVGNTANTANVATSNVSNAASSNTNSPVDAGTMPNPETASVDQLLPYVQDGSYRGTGDGFRGPVTVRVTVADHRITAITVLENNDSPTQFNAAENKVISGILENNSTDVDSASGATRSSSGIKQAVTDAIRNAVS